MQLTKILELAEKLHYGINGRLDISEDQISELKGHSNRNYPKQNTERKRIFKNEKNITELWDNFKQPNIYVTVVPKGGTEENFPNKIPKFDEKQKSTILRSLMNSRSLRKTAQRYIVTKLLNTNDKDKILKAAWVGRERHIMYSTKLRRTEHFLSETMQVTRQWSNNFQVLELKHHQPRVLLLVKISFKSKDEILFQIFKAEIVNWRFAL